MWANKPQARIRVSSQFFMAYLLIERRFRPSAPIDASLQVLHRTNHMWCPRAGTVWLSLASAPCCFAVRLYIEGFLLQRLELLHPQRT